MKVYTIHQGSEAWIRSRLGIPTASNFSKLLTPKTLKPSRSGRDYMHEKLAEVFTGQPHDGTPEMPAMIRGSEMEPEAADWYAFDRDADVQPIGFVTTDDRRVGGSPDRMVGERGGLEIKCPGPKGMIAHLLGDKEHEHRCQVQGYLWLTGRDWWDLEIYHPDLSTVVTRHEPEPEWVQAFEAALAKWLADFDAARARLIGLGLTPAPSLDEHHPEAGSLICADCGEIIVASDHRPFPADPDKLGHYRGSRMEGMTAGGVTRCSGCLSMDDFLGATT